MQIYLVDRHPPMVEAWSRAFAKVDEVEPVQGDYFDRPADAMVSPANSFGIMDGGLDRAIRDQLGFGVQDAVQLRILEEWHGELPVGAAVVVDTGDERWPRLIAAPTMRVPEPVGRTLNAYLSFRAVLIAARAAGIESLVCCGLASGIGGMDPNRCATQMFLAHRQVMAPARFPSFDAIHAVHRALKTS